MLRRLENIGIQSAGCVCPVLVLSCYSGGGTLFLKMFYRRDSNKGIHGHG